MHRRYAGHIHARMNRTGHFWQGRFGCAAMDEEHLAAALRYLALDPVRARLAPEAIGWRWSSVHAHLADKGDTVMTTAPVLARYPDFAALIAAEEDAGATARLRAGGDHRRPGRGRRFRGSPGSAIRA